MRASGLTIGLQAARTAKAELKTNSKAESEV
jgi:hypothetical protein